MNLHTTALDLERADYGKSKQIGDRDSSKQSCGGEDEAKPPLGLELALVQKQRYMSLGEGVRSVDVHDGIEDGTRAWINVSEGGFEMTEHYEERNKHPAMTYAIRKREGTKHSRCIKT
jgi:hypothetical protein